MANEKIIWQVNTRSIIDSILLACLFSFLLKKKTKAKNIDWKIEIRVKLLIRLSCILIEINYLISLRYLKCTPKLNIFNQPKLKIF